MTGRHIVITGAARGIGAAIARVLAADGHRLTLLGRRLDALQALAASLPPPLEGQHHGAAADVADEAQVQAAFDSARAAQGPVWGLVNNAGQAESAPLQRTSAELWQRMLAVNLTGSFLCCRAALADLRATGATGAHGPHGPHGPGRIVNIASTAGQRGYAYVAAYSAAKHGVVGLTRSLALELAASGVTVNAVCPGYTETDLLRESVAKVVATTGRTPEQARAEFAAGNPQRRIVQPEQVADAVRWLLGEGAAAVTGQCISVCGGEVM